MKNSSVNYIYLLLLLVVEMKAACLEKFRISIPYVEWKFILEILVIAKISFDEGKEKITTICYYYVACYIYFY